MAETLPLPTNKSERKRERQPISVPFKWEERPGTPKKDWKPSPQPMKPDPPPVKLVISVPFGWEEKPGTPLPSFTQPQADLAILPQQAHSITFSSPLGSSQDNGNWSPDDDARDGGSISELETCSFHTNESFSSAPSLLANGLISTSALLSAVPVEQSSLALNTAESVGPGSPCWETDSTVSRYATGSASLAGASFLEWLFPLLVPNSNFRDKVEMDGSLAADVKGEEFLHEGNRSQVRRPLLTLGELIVMSRRRSCQRKIGKIRKQPSMDFMKRNAFGCCIFGNVNGISELQRKWKRQLQLKLM